MIHFANLNDKLLSKYNLISTENQKDCFTLTQQERTRTWAEDIVQWYKSLPG